MNDEDILIQCKCLRHLYFVVYSRETSCPYNLGGFSHLKTLEIRFSIFEAHQDIIDNTNIVLSTVSSLDNLIWRFIFINENVSPLFVKLHELPYFHSLKNYEIEVEGNQSPGLNEIFFEGLATVMNQANAMENLKIKVKSLVMENPLGAL